MKASTLFVADSHFPPIKSSSHSVQCRETRSASHKLSRKSIFVHVTQLIVHSILLIESMVFFLRTSSSAALWRKEPPVPPGSPLGFPSNSSFGTRRNCVKGNAREVGGEGVGWGESSKSSCYLPFQGCLAARLQAHITATFYPDSSPPLLHLYLCFRAARFHACFFLRALFPGCTLTQRTPASPRDVRFLVPDLCPDSVNESLRYWSGGVLSIGSE